MTPKNAEQLALEKKKLEVAGIEPVTLQLWSNCANQSVTKAIHVGGNSNVFELLWKKSSGVSCCCLLQPEPVDLFTGHPYFPISQTCSRLRWQFGQLGQLVQLVQLGQWAAWAAHWATWSDVFVIKLLGSVSFMFLFLSTCDLLLFC